MCDLDSSQLELLLKCDLVASTELRIEQSKDNRLEEHAISDVDIEKQATGSRSNALKVSPDSFKTTRKSGNIMGILLASVDRKVPILTDRHNTIVRLRIVPKYRIQDLNDLGFLRKIGTRGDSREVIDKARNRKRKRGDDSDRVRDRAARGSS
jgi:hypothetical protein